MAGALLLAPSVWLISLLLFPVGVMAELPEGTSQRGAAELMRQAEHGEFRCDAISPDPSIATRDVDFYCERPDGEGPAWYIDVERGKVVWKEPAGKV